MKDKFRSVLLFAKLHLILIMYSIGSCFSKYAAQYDVFSFGFFACYGIVLMILLAYAVLWQQILKKLPLFIAFANKSIVVVWGMVFGRILFEEKIEWWSVIGVLLIIIGVYMVVKKSE